MFLDQANKKIQKKAEELGVKIEDKKIVPYDGPDDGEDNVVVVLGLEEKAVEEAKETFEKLVVHEDKPSEPPEPMKKPKSKVEPDPEPKVEVSEVPVRRQLPEVAPAPKTLEKDLIGVAPTILPPRMPKGPPITGTPSKETFIERYKSSQKAKGPTVAIRVHPELNTKLEETCRRLGLSKKQVLFYLLEQHLDEIG